MLLKIGKSEIKVDNWLVLVTAIIADNMYVNYCKRKSIKDLMEVTDKAVKVVKD